MGQFILNTLSLSDFECRGHCKPTVDHVFFLTIYFAMWTYRMNMPYIYPLFLGATAFILCGRGRVIDCSVERGPFQSSSISLSSFWVRLSVVVIPPLAAHRRLFNFIVTLAFALFLGHLSDV